MFPNRIIRSGRCIDCHCPIEVYEDGTRTRCSCGLGTSTPPVYRKRGWRLMTEEELAQYMRQHPKDH
jgi:hypothetical protein